MSTLFSSFSAIRLWVEVHPRARRWLVGILLWSLSAVLLFPALGTPRSIVFDEALNVPRAQRYLNHIFYQTNHPPLARLFMTLGQYILHPDAPSNEFVTASSIMEPWPENVDITGYRLFPAIFGSFLPLLAFLILLQITRNEWMAAFIGLAVALDNALLAQAHFALPESTLLFFCLLTILCFSWLQTQKKPGGRKMILAWAIFGASACAASLIKLTGLFVMVTVVFYLYKLFTSGQQRSLVPFLFTFGLAFLTVFILVWQIHFSLFTRYDPNIQSDISEAQRAILEKRSYPNPVERFRIQITDSYLYIIQFHESISPLDQNKPTEVGSAWYQWPIGGRAIPYFAIVDENLVWIIYLIGNPGVWIISLLGVIGGTGMAIKGLVIRNSPMKYHQWYLLLIGMYLTYMLPMTQITRVMYMYHYLPPMLIGLILFALVFLELPRLSNRTKSELLILATTWIVVSFWVYSPFTYFTPLTYAQFDLRNIWSPWDLHIPYEQILLSSPKPPVK